MIRTCIVSGKLKRAIVIKSSLVFFLSSRSKSHNNQIIKDTRQYSAFMIPTSSLLLLINIATLLYHLRLSCLPSPTSLSSLRALLLCLVFFFSFSSYSSWPTQPLRQPRGLASLTKCRQAAWSLREEIKLRDALCRRWGERKTSSFSQDAFCFPPPPFLPTLSFFLFLFWKQLLLLLLINCYPLIRIASYFFLHRVEMLACSLLRILLSICCLS